MRVAENTEAVAGCVIPESHLVANNYLPKQNLEQDLNVPKVPQNIGGNVVYIQHNPHSNARVTNVMQGREVNVIDDISGREIQKQHKAPEQLVYVPEKTEDEAKAPNEMRVPPNTGSERIVFVQANMPEGNVSLHNNISGTATPELNTTQESGIYVSHNMPEKMTTQYDSNQTPIRVIYVPHMPGGNVNQPSGLPGVIIHDPNNVQGQIQYAPHNVANPTPSPNNLQGYFQYAPQNISNRTPSPINSQGNFQYAHQNISNRTPSPINSQGNIQYAPQNMPNGMPAPNRIQGRSTEVLNRVATIASKLISQHENENKPENIVHTAQPVATPVVYSPYMMGDGSGFIPQMQYQSPYIPQPYLTPAYNMQPMNQASYFPPIAQPVQDGVYTSSPPIPIEQGTFVPDNVPSQLPEPDVLNSGNQFFDNMDTNAVNEDCCSWYDCCCLFSCCSGE
ncbi:hypothetical protein O3G_MSEX011371 [Manduca sexta]|uniref:Uncharacterized protein n=1 Tax=Manduca sexta TaxID=7130 RepID=A0A922CU01_MANSE|nr:hypothetical protein O3G_MSEX011371 [Manduca sexta]